MNECLSEWTEREATAEAMIPLIGRLYRKNNVVTSIYGRAIINQSVIGILRAHRFVRQVEENELSVHDTLPILETLDRLELGQAHIDIGKLAVRFREQGNGRSLEDFLRDEVSGVVGQYTEQSRKQAEEETKDVVLYGFGRIGRLLARILIEKAGGGNNLRLRAIVVRNGGAESDLEKRASLLRRDSVHGPFNGTISVDYENSALIANGNFIKVLYSDGPDQVDYTQYGINNAIVIDNTGKWRDEEGLGLHLKSRGVSRVLLTAPGKGDIKNIVYGINDQDVTEDDRILSAASCTTNAITPVLKAIHDEFGINGGHMETVHAYTNDQNLIDNYHKGSRRGRGAPLNMVLTETGAAKAVAKALPELKGKLTGNAIRVPIPNVSMAILNLNLDKAVDRDAVNDYLRDMALHSELQKQIDFVNSPEVVSSDFVGSRHAGIVDAQATIADDHRAILYVWYDNEAGYSAQVIRIVNEMAGVNHAVYPARVR
ncbi:glyceraldehyde 3-phosphate dehydrogenase [Tamilnaduibacter salinus]|nr:glyceraldehyde-3-phosphate dehydrogenase [Tamilnaduibacter salinus]PVY75452.1 glyceraldehyde 3-phosphate dehydrogenase [Tamilnaduibacter salinus]